MPLFRHLTDDEEIEKMERETQKRMNRLFDKMEGWKTFPGESTILREDNIYAKDFEKINQDSGRINILVSPRSPQSIPPSNYLPLFMR